MKSLQMKSLGVVAVAAAVVLANSVSAHAGDKARSKAPTIVEAALAANAETGEFSTLIAALQAAGLVDALNGRKQYTVFAPTDEAFAKLGLNADNIGTALPVEDLTNILLYHVTRGNRLSQSVVGAREIAMLNGDKTAPSVRDDVAYLNDSKIVAADLRARNGVIHVIDTVLLP
jgi:uncharacterized surface protein with fasciclin (FAS1) repeats